MIAEPSQQTVPVSQSVPGPAGHFLLGSMQPFKHDMLGFFGRSREQYGDFFKVRLGPAKRMHVMCHPDMAELVLIKDKDVFGKMSQLRTDTGLPLVLGKGLLLNYGESWKRQRQMMQPVFHKGHISRMAQTMTEAGDRLLARWKARKHPDQPVDLAHEMMLLTMDIVSQTMFSANILGKVDSIGDALTIQLRYAFDSLRSPLMLPVNWPTPRNIEFRKARQKMDDILFSIINERIADNAGHGDLLDMLLATRDEATGEGMDPVQLRDEVATIFGAGHETTANALTWTWYLLSRHPEVLARLQAELAQVLNGRNPVFADLPMLPYTRAVLEESMRLCPPAPIIPRAVLKNADVLGYPLRRGDTIIVSAYQIHRHPDFWPDPLSFDPERFLPQANPTPRHRCAYLPFGLGQRVCIGNHFALMEGQLLLAQIAQHVDLQLLAGHPVEEEVAVTMRPRYGMLMTMRARP